MILCGKLHIWEYTQKQIFKLNTNWLGKKFKNLKKSAKSYKFAVFKIRKKLTPN